LPQALFRTRVLEVALRKNDPTVLSMFPAGGFKNGVAGFFKRHGLYVVPDSEQAWCQDGDRGRLKRGCYVVIAMQLNGRKPKDSAGNWCGSFARWYKPPRSGSYEPVPGWAGLALPIAEGNAGLVLDAVKEDDRRRCN
jgi:hypothetical protein